jgi:uroporphyrinogen-III decarboxylase
LISSLEHRDGLLGHAARAAPDERHAGPGVVEPHGESRRAFDAVKEYALPPFDELVAYYQRCHNEYQGNRPRQLLCGGYYKTIMSGAIEAFGWDLLLEAAAEQDKFERVLDTIYQRSLYHYKAWAKTDIAAFICHDDFVWSEGAFIHPDFYRRVIIPRYRELWKPLRAAGKKVLFCSDANWIEFVDDIVAAGADGLIFEPMMPLDPVVERYGKTHVIVGSKVDVRTMTFGTPAAIQAEIDATLKLAFDCPGFVFIVGNHIPSNVPVSNALFYFDYLKKHWERK